MIGEIGWDTNALTVGEERPFISCDTETYTPPGETKQKVMLFGLSDGVNNWTITPREKDNGDISSSRMLGLIRRVAKENAHRKPIYFGFGFKFDVNFLLRMPLTSEREAQRILRDEEPTYLGPIYNVQYVRDKFFDVKTRNKSMHARIYEVMGFFNHASLVSAYAEQIGEDTDWYFVSSGKELRPTFQLEELDEVISYWTVEQRMYVRLMNHMRKLIIRADIPQPRHWMGPSSLVAGVYQRYHVKDHMETMLPDDFLDATQRGYYGGRFEQFMAGSTKQKIYQLDIVSAYPSAMVGLWSWQGANLRYVSGSELDRNKPMPREFQFSLWDVTLDYRRHNFFEQMHLPMPFPQRGNKGQVYYPSYTHTTVWSPELSAFWQDPDVTIHGGWVIEDNGDRPFAFIKDLYDKRRRLKNAGDPAQYALKILLNSGYGKVAQRAGAKFDESKGWRIPPYHQLDWAGYITSACRAKLWRAMSELGTGRIVSVETDGIFSLANPEFECTGELGGWELSEWNGMVSVQSGIYWLRKGPGEWSDGKARGLTRAGVGALELDTVLEWFKEWNKDSVLPVNVHRFHGIGDYGREKWLSWEDSVREIKLAGEGKRRIMVSSKARKQPKPWDQMIRTWNNAAHLQLRHSAKNPELCHTFPHNIPWRDYGDVLEFEERMEEFDGLGYIEE